MRYLLPTDRLINQLVPHYLSGRKYILFLQSLVYPLSSLNGRFVLFAKEKQIEARMTSQTLYFEWYLNRTFRHCLAHPEERIYISESTNMGVEMYHEHVPGAKPFTLWKENEPVTSVKEDEMPRELYFLTEETTMSKASFMVCVPEITISEREFVYMLSYVVNRYKLAGKTCLIKINAKEVERSR
jgi:hypothetical protein